MKKLFAVFLVPAALVAACSGGSSTPTPQPTTTPSISGTVTVFAATSLTDVFNEEGQAFQKQYPTAKVTFN
ncbi:MAG: hypothetical protein HY261_02595, partial [Chloroflexi bacterium]|nr:hypothetical protein [Chloroflexota bacterium]